MFLAGYMLKLDAGAFARSEPAPFRVFAVSTLDA
jgi:hypothetical protein